VPLSDDLCALDASPAPMPLSDDFLSDPEQPALGGFEAQPPPEADL